MRYRDFENQFIVGAYVLGKNTSDQRTSSGEILDGFVIDWQEGWVHQLISDLGRRGLLHGKGTIGDERSQPVMLTASGLKEAERLEDAGVRVEARWPPARVVTPDTMQTSTAMSVPPLHIDSASWTGVQQRIELNPALLNQIRSKVQELDGLVEQFDLTNFQHGKAKALTEALVKLVESPEPEWQIIVMALQSPTLAAILGLAGLAQLILKIMFGIG